MTEQTARKTVAQGSWSRGKRPITIAILAMGGEGGGVLSGWIASVAEQQGYFSQTTQVAGVAQRTGATVYYVELFPQSEAAGDSAARTEPVLSMFPIPGQCDIVIASELMEAGRAVQRGFVTPDRTTFIASTNRVYSILEKSHLGDGRVESDKLVEGAYRAAKRFVGADFMTLATEARSVISASLFGALAGSGALPFPREAYEAAIEAAGKGVKPSLAAFAAGYQRALDAIEEEKLAKLESGQSVMLSIGRRPGPTPEELEEERKTKQAADDPCSLIGPKLQRQGRRIAAEFPAPARLMLVRGCLRTALYQDDSYADRYLDRVKRLLPLESDPEGEAAIVTESARHVALLMTYQDTIQVAFQKIRAKRLADIRVESRAADDELVDVYEYLHPQVEEITDTMPSAAGRLLRANRVFGAAVRGVGGKGIVVNTTSVPGYTTLATLANLRPMRPSTLRFKQVQREIDAWLDLVVRIGASDTALAEQLVRCAHVVKGYAETHANGMASFERLQRAAVQLQGKPEAAERLKTLREAALSDEGGKSLDAACLAAGIAGVEEPEKAMGVDGAPVEV